MNSFEDTIISAILYGSTVNNDFCKMSDYDILLIFKELGISTLEKIRNIEENFENQGIKIDFNTHLVTDLPENRKHLFWHNNRSLFIQMEFAMTGVVIIGNNPFKDYYFDKEKMLEEAVKMINSFNYQARKILINKILLIKWCIYGALYALAAKGYYYENRRDALRHFTENYRSEINPEEFLDIKMTHADKISLNELSRAYEFLQLLDKLIFAEYEENNR